MIRHPPHLADQVGGQGGVVHLRGEGLPVHAAEARPLFHESVTHGAVHHQMVVDPHGLPGVSVHVGGHGHVSQREPQLVQFPLCSADHQLQLVLCRRPHGVQPLFLGLHGQALAEGPGFQARQPLVRIVQSYQQVSLCEVRVEQAGQRLLRAVLVLRLLPGGVPQTAL